MSENHQNHICMAGGLQPLAAEKPPFRAKFGMMGVLFTIN